LDFSYIIETQSTIKIWIKEGIAMIFRRGQRVEVFRKSDDEGWESYMDAYIGAHGIITDPDSAINDPDALVEVSLEDKGTHRLPQDCLRLLDD
jgi:hypothetical protein